VHKAQHEVLQLVCDDRKAGDLWTADGADPVDKAPYKYTINGAVGAVFSFVSTGGVKVSVVVNDWTRGRVVKEWQARTSARGSRRTGRVRIDFEG
jgi:hypothetical protein